MLELSKKLHLSIISKGYYIIIYGRDQTKKGICNY